jgi:hypothetical protein
MKNKNIKKSIKKTILLTFLCVLFFVPKVHASTLTLAPSKNSVGLGEQFYVDVMLDPQNVSLNGIEDNVTFAENNVSFVRAETGQSLINFWIEQPKLIGNTISFSGVIPGGFDGVIDPFNPQNKLPGLMVRLVFKGIQPGTETFSSAPASVTQNDGLGTLQNISSANTSINITNVSNPFVYKNTNDNAPQIQAYVTRDPNLFNDKYTLVFSATDSGTGIKDVMIKEGNRNWKEITSPYLLEDQGRHSTIALEAVNYSGATIIVTINPLPYKLFSPANILLFILLLFIIFFIVKKIYESKKRKEQEKI